MDENHSSDLQLLILTLLFISLIVKSTKYLFEASLKISLMCRCFSLCFRLKVKIIAMEGWIILPHMISVSFLGIEWTVVKGLPICFFCKVKINKCSENHARTVDNHLDFTNYFELNKGI